MWNKQAFNFQYLRENYKEIIKQGSRMLWEHFPEAALLNMVHLVYQGVFLLGGNIEESGIEWIHWTERLLSLILVAVAAELWRERRPQWQPGKYRWRIWGLLALWAAVLEGGTRILQGFENMMFHIVSPCFWLIIVCYLLLPTDKEQQSKHLRKCVYTFAAALALTSLFGMLITTCISAVHTLLVPLPKELEIFLAIVVPFTFGVYAFLVLLSTTKALNLVSDSFTVRTVKYLLFPGYALLLLILYLYIGKIIIWQSMPVGEMNWYASLALLGYGFFYFFWNDTEWSWFKKFMRWALILFIPILVLQFYGVWIRYYAYGLTQLRYASMICTAYGILLLNFGFWRLGIRPLLLIGAALLMVFTVTPLNVMRVPLHNQQARLIGLLEQEGLYEDGEIIMSHPISPERAPAIKSCVDYIRKEKYLKESNEAFGLQVKNIAWNDYYPQTKKDNKKNPPQQKNKVVFAPRHSGIPVEGYKVAYTFTIKKNEAVIKLEDGKERKVNVSPYVRQLMAAQQGVTGNSKVYLDEAYKLDDRSVLYFTEIVVNQTGDSKNYKISGRGFFLQK